MLPRAGAIVQGVSPLWGHTRIPSKEGIARRDRPPKEMRMEHPAPKLSLAPADSPAAGLPRLRPCLRFGRRSLRFRIPPVSRSVATAIPQIAARLETALPRRTRNGARQCPSA